MSHHIRDFWGTLGEGPLCAVTSLGATPPKPWLTSTKPILDSSDVWAPESKTFFDKKVQWTREGGGLGQLLVFPVLTKRLADKYQSVLRHCLQPWTPTGAENAHRPWPRLTPLSRQVLSSLASDSLHRPSTWNTLDFFPCWLTPHSPQASGQLFFWRHPLTLLHNSLHPPPPQIHFLHPFFSLQEMLLITFFILAFRLWKLWKLTFTPDPNSQTSAISSTTKNTTLKVKHTES